MSNKHLKNSKENNGIPRINECLPMSGVGACVFNLIVHVGIFAQRQCGVDGTINSTQSIYEIFRIVCYLCSSWARDVKSAVQK